MFKFIIVAVISLIVGAFGWAQIIGSIQNIRHRKYLLFTLILWTTIMAGGAYLAIVTFDSLWALVIGYGISFVQVISVGKVE